MSETTDHIDSAKRIFIRQNIELFILTLIIFILGVCNQWVNPYLQFDREALVAGQWWRVLSCNLVHLSVTHMLMNLTGFILATLIFKEAIRALYWYINIVVCALAVGLGIWLFDDAVRQYVGLSGALYGILAFGIVLNFRRQMLISSIVGAYIVHRVYLQHQSSFDPAGMYDFIGGNVIVSSHLFGLIAGLSFAGYVMIKTRAEGSAKRAY